MREVDSNNKKKLAMDKKEEETRIKEFVGGIDLLN